MKTAFSLIVGLLFCLSSHASQKTYSLLVYDNPPFVMVDGGKFQGIAVNVVRALFEKAGLHYEFQNVPALRALRDARTNPLTCVFPVQRAQDVEAEYQWVSPILVTHSGLFMLAGSGKKFISLSDAKGYTVGALRGSGEVEYLKRFGFEVEEAKTQEQNLMMLLNKRFDIWATDVLSQEYFARKHAENAKATEEMLTFRRTLSSLACNPATPKQDLQKLQKTLDAMIKDGSLHKLTSMPP